MKKVVWEFTNQRKLNKGEFISYFERKVFATIRKFEMLPEDKIFKLKKTNSLNINVLRNVLEKKFDVEYSRKGNVDDLNLSDFADKIFLGVLKGEFVKLEKIRSPLYFLSDNEIELYASLLGISGEKKKRNKRVQKVFGEFFEKNPDLEHNVVGAAESL